MSTETEYTNCLTLEQMEYLDLFDEIPYKVVKKLVKLDDDTDFEVEIKDLPNDDYNKRFTSFKFTLEVDISGGCLPLMVEKHYCVIKEYDGSSPMAMFIDENLVEEEEDEEDFEDFDENKKYICWKCNRDFTDECDDRTTFEKRKERMYMCMSCHSDGEEKEEESEEEEECVSHPPYHCDGGCGKIMGEGNEDDCNRTCESCDGEEEEEDKHECELCKKHVQETEYLPSKEDEEKQQILGNDYCLECYKKVEKFEFVENIEDEEKE
jgi:hypothetical protein